MPPQDRNTVSVDRSLLRDPQQATEIRRVRATEVDLTAPNEPPPLRGEDFIVCSVDSISDGKLETEITEQRGNRV